MLSPHKTKKLPAQNSCFEAGSNQLMKKGSGKWYLNLMLVLALMVLVLMLLNKTLFKNNTFSAFGYSAFLVSSASMQPEFPVNSVVIVKKTSISDLSIGDVIVYKSEALNGGLVMHRVTKLHETGAFTKGDMNAFDDNQIVTDELLVGKKIFSVTFIARYLAIISTIRGFFVFFLMPFTAIFLALLSFKLTRKARNKP